MSDIVYWTDKSQVWLNQPLFISLTLGSETYHGLKWFVNFGFVANTEDVAVSTACGMLDAIVVESTEDAQAVIEFVRRQEQ